MDSDYDMVIIGGGSAGYAAARTAHDYGMRTAVIDSAKTLGGLCILRGCMPSKTLIESSNRFRAIREAEQFGLRAEQTAVKTDEIIERKRRLIDEFAEYRQEQLTDGRFDLIRGTAVFSGPKSMTVSLDEGGEQEISFRSTVIATGSKIQRVPIEGLEETGYWTSNDVLDADKIPESIIVLGGGAIALEMACYLEGIGREVTVIQRSKQLITGSDADIAEELCAALQSRDGLSVYTGTTLASVGRDAASGKKTVTFIQGGETITVVADEILQGLGRSPNAGGLALENAGITITERGGWIATNAQQETSAEQIYAAGDVCGPHPIVHIAIEQGEIAAHNAAVSLGFSPDHKREIDYQLKILGIFTEPAVAMVGMTEADAKEAGRSYQTAKAPFNDHGKSMIHGSEYGFVKMIADSDTGEILGASVIGPEAVELIHELVVAMYFRATTADFLKIPHYHPTLSEIWLYPAEDLLISD